MPLRVSTRLWHPRSKVHGRSATEWSKLQYEVANLSFQQEIVTNIAKKASDAVSTLVKNG